MPGSAVSGPAGGGAGSRSPSRPHGTGGAVWTVRRMSRSLTLPKMPHSSSTSAAHVSQAGHQARICLTDLDPGQALPRSRAAGQDDVTRIGLNQHSPDILAAGMIRQDTDHVVTLPGAQAHQRDPARRCRSTASDRCDRTHLSRALNAEDGSS